MAIVTPKQMAFLERRTDESGTSLGQLMENAASALAAKIKELLPDEGRVLFLCGNGNNAGDCFAAARMLNEEDIECTVILLCGMPGSELAKENFGKIFNITTIGEHEAALKLLGTQKFDIIADGVFGTGFHGELPENVKEIFDEVQLNNENAKYIAVDVPSGGNCLAGTVSEGMIKPDITITFGCKKFGMIQYPLSDMCGEIVIADIGIPEKLIKELDYEIKLTDAECAKSVIPERPPYSHKGNYGKLLTVCGSDRMPGACVMSAEAAAKSGVGLLECATTRFAAGVIASRLPEAMLRYLDSDYDGFFTENNYDHIMYLAGMASAVLIGCGIGTSDGTKNLVKRLVCDISCPIILDADGINCIADSIDIIKRKENIILTPHPGEMGRLLGVTAKEIQSDRLTAAADLAKEYGAVVVLKGAGTIIAGSEGAFVNTTGNAGMAKGGSGDVLSGIIASLAAQSIGLYESAVLGAYVHGLAGDIAARKLSMQSMTAEDIISSLPEAFMQVTPPFDR